MTPTTDLQSLPLYRCHKEVRAAKIAHWRYAGSMPQLDGAKLVFLEGYPDPVLVPEHVRIASAGGYLVVYADGYVSWSPGKAFEHGYTRHDSE